MSGGREQQTVQRNCQKQNKTKTKQKETVNILLPIISQEKDFVIILVAVFAIHASAIMMLCVAR